MKTAALALICSSLIWTMTMQPAIASTPKPAGPCIGYGVNHATPPAIRSTKMHALIRCAFTWAHISSQTSHAFYVANRESRLVPWAANPWTRSACRPWSSSAYGSCGLFQHLARYWPGRVRAHLKAWWFPKTYPQVNPYNARANALTTALMVRAGGWGPWGG
jgi:hypothetical protein